MNRILTLLIMAFLTATIYAQTDEKIDEWAQKGLDALEKGRYQQAIPYFENIKEAYEKQSKIDEEYEAVLSLLSNCCSEVGNYAKAVELKTKILELNKAAYGENHPDYAMSLSDLANNYFNLGEHEKAMELWTKTLDIYKDNHWNNNPHYATSLIGLSNYYSYLGDYAKAIEYGTMAMEIYKTVLGENHTEYASSLTILANYYSYIGDYAKAVAFGTKAMEIRKGAFGEHHPSYAMSLSNLGNFYAALGDYAKAVEYGTKALEIYKVTIGDSHPNYALSLNNLANYFSYLGDYNKAVEYGTKAMEIRKVTLGESHPDYAISLGYLSQYYFDLGDYNKAVEYGTKSMEIIKEALGVNHPYFATTATNLSNYYATIGDYNKAMEIETTAKDTFYTTLGENHPYYATSLSNIANYYHLLGNPIKAVEFGKKALEIRKVTLGKNHPDYASSLNNLALFYSNLGYYTEALEYLQHNLSVVQSNIILQFGNLTSSQRASYWTKNSFLFSDIYPFIFYLSNNSTNPESPSDLYDKSALFAKGLLLTTEIEMNKLILESGDEEALRMFEELQKQRLLLQKLYDMPITERFLDTDSLAQVADVLESKLVKKSNVYGDFTNKLRTTWKDVQTALGKDEIAVEFLSFKLYGDSTLVAALTLRKDDKGPKFIPLFEQKQMKALDDSPVLKRNKKDETKFRKTLHYIRPEVSKLVWKPIQEELRGIRRIYFSPAGILHSIGIEYLPGMEDFEIRRLSTTREIIDIKEKGENNMSDNAMATLYGGINYEEANTNPQTPKGNEDASASDSISRSIPISMHHAFVDSIGARGDSLKYLKGTLTEVENIRTSLEKNNHIVGMFTGNEATETSIKTLSAHAPAILHIATHGKLYSEKEQKLNDALRNIIRNDDRLGATELEDKALTRSVLFFAGANKTLQDESIPMNEEDGILTAQEISKLDLRGLDLVVLSACETGMGDITQGEGVFGLQRGFKKAGVGTIVMSLWKIDDDATEMMMTQFYKNLCKGMVKHEALHNAQKHLRDYTDGNGEKKYNYPHYWAGFVVLD